MIYSIYKIKNLINGKAYIGMTARDPSKRWWEHCNIAEQKSGYFIHQAIRKYGSDYFSFQVIVQTKIKEHLKDLEILMIKEHNTHMSKNGYNKTWGGDGAPFIGKAGAKDRNNGKSLGLVDCNDPRWKSGEIVSCKQGIKRPLNANIKSSEYWKGKRKGSQNGNAKTYLLISPNGKEYEVTGRLVAFCEDMNISFPTIVDHINTGIPVPESSIYHKARESERRRNTTGWVVNRK